MTDILSINPPAASVGPSIPSVPTDKRSQSFYTIKLVPQSKVSNYAARPVPKNAKLKETLPIWAQALGLRLV